MIKNIALGIAVSGVLIVLYSVVGKSPIANPYVARASVPHFFGKPDVPIDRIEIIAMYFVPKDRIRSALNNWQEVLQTHLEKLQEFHDVQFLGRSSITYTFLPEIVIGQKKGSVYEVFTPSHTDPLSIDPIVRELSVRLLDQAGDLWRSEMAHTPSGVRRVYIILFEGEGAAGSGDVALISRSFFTDKAYTSFATTFLAHEFYHTLGVPDAYESSSYVFEDAQQTQVGLLEGEDIMGRVRVPIEYTYIDREALDAMGI